MMDLLKLMKERHSSRVFFDSDQPVSKENIAKILEAGSWAPTAHNMQNFEVIIVDDKKLIQIIAGMKAPVSLKFIKENYKQLSFSNEELKKKKTGILGTMFPPNWRNPHIRKDDLTETGRDLFMQEELLSTPVLGIVLYDPFRRAPASPGDFLGIMSLGCVMENMWLMASSLGIDFHIVSSLSNGSIKRGIKKLLNIPDRLIIAYSFRLGYAAVSASYLRVRRDVKDFMHYNGYSNKTSSGVSSPGRA
jgi:nitroreductase